MTFALPRRRLLQSAVGVAALSFLAPRTWAAEPQAAEDEKLFQYLEDRFDAALARSPDFRTYLGVPGRQGEWTPRSDAFDEESARISKEELAWLRREIDPTRLSPAGRINYDLGLYAIETSIEEGEFLYDYYAFNRLDGGHIDMPTLLITAHRVSDLQGASDYISRLRGMPRVLEDMLEATRRRAAKGVVMPALNYGPIAEAARAVVSGQPFDQGPGEAPLLSDFRSKVDKLTIPDEQKRRLITAAVDALKTRVGPAYRSFAAAVEEMGKGVTDNHGVWALPRGEELYRMAVKWSTTLPLTADAVHETGLKEVTRIQAEMKGIMDQVGFAGEVPAFLAYLRNEPRFVLPGTPEGRKEYIDRATAVISTMEANLDKIFGVKPKARLEIRPVEAFRENSTAGAFYQPPSLDGSRPGLYYANMSDMKALPTWDLETLAYHEAIPGHHMQIAIAQELEGVPRLRKIWNTTAYAEGWALYAEYLGKEMGFFQDPYSDAGRLAAELFRACRLVVDTGIHAKKWSREKAIAYMNENTPNAEVDNVREVERYINWPGQALGYKIGMIEIQRLRAAAEQRLGPRFDIRGFHDTVLANGAVPLPLLGRLVDEWAARLEAA